MIPLCARVKIFKRFIRQIKSTLKGTDVLGNPKGYHEYMTEWEPRSGDVYRVMREPNNVNDSTVAGA